MKVFSANFSRLCLYLSASLVVSGAVAKPARILKRSSVARRSVTSAGRPLTQFNIRENRSGLSRIRRQDPSPAFNAVVPEATGTTVDSEGNAFAFGSVFGAVVPQDDSGNTPSVSANAGVSSLNPDGANLAGGSAYANGINLSVIQNMPAASPFGNLVAAVSSTSNGASGNESAESINGVAVEMSSDNGPSPNISGLQSAGVSKLIRVALSDGSPGNSILGSSSASTSISGISPLVNLGTGAPPIAPSVAGLGGLQRTTPVAVGRLTVNGNSPANVASAAGTGGDPTANNDSVSANLANVSDIAISSATGPSGAAPNAEGASGSIDTTGAGTVVRPSANSDSLSANTNAGTDVLTAGGNNPSANLASVPGGIIAATIPSDAAMPNGVAASVNTAGAGTGVQPSVNGVAAFVNTAGAGTGVQPSVNGNTLSAVAANVPLAGGNNLGANLATVPENVVPAAIAPSGAASVNIAGAGMGNPTANGDILSALASAPGNVMILPESTGSGAGIPNPNTNGDSVSATVSGTPIPVPSVNSNPNSANTDSQPASLAGAPTNVLSGDPNFDPASINASGSPEVNANTPSASLSGTGNGPAVNGGTPSASSSSSGNGLPVSGSNISATANTQGSGPSSLTAPDADSALTASTSGIAGGAMTGTDDAIIAIEELGMNTLAAANVADDDADIDAEDDTAHVGVGLNMAGGYVE